MHLLLVISKHYYQSMDFFAILYEDEKTSYNALH